MQFGASHVMNLANEILALFRKKTFTFFETVTVE